MDAKTQYQAIVDAIVSLEGPSAVQSRGPRSVFVKPAGFNETKRVDLCVGGFLNHGDTREVVMEGGFMVAAPSLTDGGCIVPADEPPEVTAARLISYARGL